ncbi:YceI family protein [Zooshikella harenae]|uniref:YceI family protein n=1 Tax=Zooshikella harenae TaxID=2827238 RepID=A0ABS5ZH49_9GAMM|nr:YceI family protein [Zooshikella harenae]MBU2713203.1 YceI family protein [Zooshikella harenae]
MSTLRKSLAIALLPISMSFASIASAADYVIDTKDAHAFIQFKIKHLGYSWLLGRFNDFEGTFSYDDKKPTESKVNVTIKTASVDSNHAERDKHLRSEDFLNVSKYPTATFNSKKITENGNGTAKLIGVLTLHGVTKEITIDVNKIGEGKDPWGSYRAGFEGTTKFALKDFNIKDVGPTSQEVEMYLSIEGVRKP